MPFKKIAFLACLLFTAVVSFAQDKPIWNKKKCAVALTYDDALQVDLDNAIPVLDSLRLKASFYLSGYFPGFIQNVAAWKKVAQHGHELGNHSLFHPCNGNLPGRSWVKTDYNLATYTVQRMTDEMRMTNTLLEALDGKKERTFAYPCGETMIGDSFYLDRKDFIAARTTEPKMTGIDNVDLYRIGCYTINGQSGDELIALVKKAMETNTFITFLFHGVGGGHSLNVSLEAHRKLLYFLKANQKDIWVAPFIEITKYIKAHSKTP